jgi:hypothetical protein
MTIIRGGEEIKVDNQKEFTVVPEDEGEEPDEEIELPYEALIEEQKLLGDSEKILGDDFNIPLDSIMKNRKLIRGLILLLVKKGVITASEIEELFKLKTD